MKDLIRIGKLIDLDKYMPESQKLDIVHLSDIEGKEITILDIDQYTDKNIERKHSTFCLKSVVKKTVKDSWMLERAQEIIDSFEDTRPLTEILEDLFGSRCVVLGS